MFKQIDYNYDHDSDYDYDFYDKKCKQKTKGKVYSSKHIRISQAKIKK